MNNLKEYNVFINAKILSSLKAKHIERQLVASLFDIETGVQINDGDNEKFEVLDYNFTDVIETI